MNQGAKPYFAYHECNLEGHSCEPLSRICIDKDCKAKTLLCCVCEYTEHKNHNTVPLKTFLQRIEKNYSLQNHTLNPLYYSNEVQKMRDKYFSTLQRYRTEINNLFHDLQAIGNLYYNKCGQNIVNLLQMGDPYNMFAGCSSVKSIKEYFRKILTMVDYEEEKDNLILKKKLDRIVEMCKEKEDRLKKNLEIISVEGKKAYSKCLEITVAIGNAFPSSLLKWSETLKGAKIKITGNIAEQTSMEASGQRFGLIEPSLSQTDKTRWGIKVNKFVGWVGAGICLKNHITNANFNFSYTTTGHGSYMISSNGYSWSHSQADLNSVMKSFHFNTVGDIIYLEYDPKENKIRFAKGPLGVEKFQLTVVPPPAGDSYNPCINLCSTGDTVELIQPGINLS